MKIYDQKILEVDLNGKLIFVSVNELFQLIVDGFAPQLTAETLDELRRLMWLTTQIFVQGDWMLQPSRRVPFSLVKENKKTSKR